MSCGAVIAGLRTLLAGAMLLLADPRPLAADHAPDPGLFPPTGRLEYGVFRKGKRIGGQSVDFSLEEGRYVVRTRIELAVEFVFLTAYRFEHDAEEVWVEGQLQRFTSRTNDDGRSRVVEARRQSALLEVNYNGKISMVPGDILPASLWHPLTARQTILLDPIKGRVRDVSITDVGMETMTLDGAPVPTHHFSITGEIMREVWYGPDGHVVQVRFPAKDGSEIMLRRLRSVAP
jgi:hypothetical protein